MAVDVSKKASKPTWRDSLAAAVAVCALLAFLALVLLMFLQRGSSETTWSRLVYLLTGLEAVAFAGAGWIFGKEVHKAEAQRAEQEVQTERQRASESEDKAREASEVAHAEQIRGARLVQAVETAHAQRSALHGEEREIASRSRPDDALASVAGLARQLYPELYSD